MKKILLVSLALVMALTLVMGSVSTVSAAGSARASGGGSFISGSGWDDEPWDLTYGHSCLFSINAQKTGDNTATGTFQFADKTSKIIIDGTFSYYFYSETLFTTTYAGECKITGNPNIIGTQKFSVDIREGSNRGNYYFQIIAHDLSDRYSLYAYAGSLNKGNLIIK